MRKCLVGLVFGFLFVLQAPVLAACLNASPSVTIPLTGTATVTVYDQICDVLPATGSTVVIQGGIALNSTTTAPNVLADGTGLHFAANGAVPGFSGTFNVTYPNGKVAPLTFVVGTPVTGISFGTTNP